MKELNVHHSTFTNIIVTIIMLIIIILFYLFRKQLFERKIENRTISLKDGYGSYSETIKGKCFY